MLYKRSIVDEFTSLFQDGLPAKLFKYQLKMLGIPSVHDFKSLSEEIDKLNQALDKIEARLAKLEQNKEASNKHQVARKNESKH